MQRTMLHAKIHRVTTTHSERDYEGSCAIDGTLLEAADIAVHEQIHIYNVTTGARFVTYAILGEPDSGMISVNGAAAHLAAVGDILIIANFVQLDASEAKTHRPNLVYVDEKNCIRTVSHAISEQKDNR